MIERRQPEYPVGLDALHGMIPRASGLRPIYAEDFSILVNYPRRFTFTDNQVRVLS